MLAAALLMALAGPPSPEPREPRVEARARAVASVTILLAAEVRNGETTQHHQRRQDQAPDGSRLTLIEFE